MFTRPTAPHTLFLLFKFQQTFVFPVHITSLTLSLSKHPYNNESVQDEIELCFDHCSQAHNYRNNCLHSCRQYFSPCYSQENCPLQHLAVTSNTFLTPISCYITPAFITSPLLRFHTFVRTVLCSQNLLKLMELQLSTSNEQY